MTLRGKVVVVTGASSGIGADAARLFAAQGARVLLVARTQGALDALAEEIRGRNGEAYAYPADLSDLSSVTRAAKAMLRDHPPPDAIVNNAGLGRWLSIEETPADEALQMTMVPYVGAFVLTRELIGPMIARGSGRIINVTSPAAYVPFPGAVAYSVARGAMRHFINALHSDLRGTGVSTALVVCGVVESDYFDNNPGVRERVPGVSRFYLTLSTTQAAQAIVRAAAARGRRLVVPVLMRWTLWLWFAAPWLVQGLTDQTGYRRPAR